MSREEEERDSKSIGNRIIEESLELDISSNVRGRNLLCVFLMPHIPIDLRQSFLFLLARLNILTREGGKYECI